MLNAARSKAGFTLVEIMVVLAIIGAMIAVAAPRLFKSETKLKPIARHLLVLGREIRHRARMTNSVMRLVIDFDPEKGAYWVEKASGITKVDPTIDPNNIKDEDKEKKSPFELDTLLNKKKKMLPANLRFLQLESIHREAPIKENLGYIYFSPEGFVEASALQIADKSSPPKVWTFIFNPVTGYIVLVEEARSLKDVAQ